MKTQKKNGNLYFMIALLIMGILFYSSSQTYEEQTAVPLLEKVLKDEPFKEQLSHVSLSYSESEVSIQKIGYAKFVEFFIRKGAHFFTYFLLGASLFAGTRIKIKQNVIALFLAWLSATGYAALDEYHQLLTGGRSPLFQDVMLDSSGALTASVLLLIFLTWRNRSKSKKK